MVSIVSSETVSGDTFLRNRSFDISFGVSPPMDVSMILNTSPISLGSNISSNRFVSTTGFSSLGSQGFLSVSAVSNGITVATSNYPVVVNSRIDTSWTSVGGLLTLYKYEPFGNTFTAKVGGDILSYPGSSTELLGYLVGTGTDTVQFRGANGGTTVYPYNVTLAVRASASGVAVDDVSTSVSIKPARLIYSPCNATATFYRNEPITPITFSILYASLSPTVFYSATTLPAGLSLSKTGTSSFALSGTPTVQTISSNFSFFAQDTSGRTYSTQVALGVSPERLLIDVAGSLATSNIDAGVAIDPITFTARFPPYNNNAAAIQYSWSPLPPFGLQFFRKDETGISGSNTTINYGTDSSFTMVLRGSIPESVLQSYAFGGITSYTMTLTGVRSGGGPALSPSAPKTLTFGFKETIFFTPTLQTLYVGLDTAVSFAAKTYFPTSNVDISIAGISLVDGLLPDGLAGSFNAAAQRYDISGIPTNAASYSFSLVASNSRGTTKTLPVNLTISNDAATISPPASVDLSYTFLQYRNVGTTTPGLYTAPITFRVGSLSGRPAVLTGANLPAGVSVSSSGSNAYDLTGIPTTAVSNATATLTATVPSSGATTTRTFLYSVSAEVITMPDVSLAFVQNVPITPVRFTASTQSGQPVVRFSSSTIPPALDLGNTGEATGTVLGSAPTGTFEVTAFTPFSSRTKSYSYTTAPDAVLLEPKVYTTVTAPGGNVSIPIDAYSLTASTVSNFRFGSAFPYGLTVNPTTGLLSGTLASSLPSNVSFTVVGSVGLVDGSLGGTMTTTNLTTNRAQILRNDYDPSFLGSAPTLYIYLSDNNGLVWSNAYTSGTGIGSSLYASTVGTNGSTLYIVPTSSNFVLKSSTGSNYDPIIYDTSGTPRASAILNKPGTSTWWMVGTRNIDDTTRGTFLYTSSNDGVTWTRSSNITTGGFTARDGNLLSSGQWSPYIQGGASLAYKDGVLLLGGTRILRSTDEGQTWSTVVGGFTTEVGGFSVDHEVVWVATGSDRYSTLSNATYTGTPANTVCYSVDTGLSWTYGAGGFNLNGYEVRYGNGAWLATGVSTLVSGANLQARYSFDAVNWTQLTSVPSVSISETGRAGDLYRLTTGFDENEWKIVRAPSTGGVTMYSHLSTFPMDYEWTATDISGSFANRTSETRFASYAAQTIDPGADVTTITFPLPNTGPTFTSPAQSTYVFWQYMPIPSINFTAVDGGSTIQYFISPLPTGLRWFSTQRDVSGACMRLGRQSFTVYAKSGAGITSFPVTLVVDVPRIIKQQGGAGAYTALLRDYTEVNAAQAGRDTRAFPAQVAGIGQLASPYPPVVVTPSNCPC